MRRIAYGLAALLGIAITAPVMAANENVITQSKALAGNVTPGDTPGFPITINTPGAYVFGSGIDVPAGQWGIVVNVHNVDIDMSGYTLSGNGNADYGIVSGNNDSRIHDGNINTFKGSGVYLRGNAWAFTNMRIQRNSGFGIDGTNARFIEVRNSLVASNGNSGMQLGENALVASSLISSNGGEGIYCLAKCNVQNNTVDANNGAGIFATSGVIIGNAVTGNAGYGIGDNGLIGDLGLANNMQVGNVTISTTGNQSSGGLAMHPNGCSGKPCPVP